MLLKRHYYNILVGKREKERQTERQRQRETERQRQRQREFAATNIICNVWFIEDSVLKSTVRKRHYYKILVVFVLPLRTYFSL